MAQQAQQAHRNMNILIAVPTFENIYPDTFKSIYDLDVSGHDTSFEFVRGYDCATARNRIAQLAIDKGADFVLMVDNDVVLPSDALVNLLDDPKDGAHSFYYNAKGELTSTNLDRKREG